MYFMLTGQTPFPDGTIAANWSHTRLKSRNRSRRSARMYRPRCLRCSTRMMAKRAEDRYQEPIEVADALSSGQIWTSAPRRQRRCRDSPLVLTLTGHSMDKSGSQVPLRGRCSVPVAACFVPVAVGFNHPSRRFQSRITRQLAAAEFGFVRRRNVTANGPVSTARTTAQATRPILPRPPKAAAKNTDTQEKHPAPHATPPRPQKPTGMFCSV